jgi:RNA polymerase sigma-70 factor (ECF subfamily)
MRDTRSQRPRSAETRDKLPTPQGGADAEDRALIGGIATSDARALATVYDRFAPLVYGVLLRMLQSSAAAEDLLQEVFWALWTRPERYDPQRGSLRVFLFQLARSRALDHMRRERRRSGLLRSTPAPPPEEGESSIQSNPFFAAVSAEDRTRVQRALAGLPQAQRRVLALSYFDGLSHSEIAEQLGEPLGTVKTRIRGGLARMRARLSGDDAEHGAYVE